MSTPRIAAATAAATGIAALALVGAGCSFGGTETVTVTAPTTPTTATSTTETTATTSTATTSTAATTTGTTTATTSTSTTGTTTTKPAENPTLKANKEIQQDLSDLGFYSGPINGQYGPITTAAVKRFQARAGLPTDGIAGPQTMAAINLALGNDSTDAVELLQTALEGLCYYGGKVDGVFGSGTESALIAFQKQAGIQADGRYGPATATALAAAWPNRPSSCSGKTPSGGGGGATTGDTLTIGSPKVSRTFDLSSCEVVGRGVQATGSASGGYKVGLDSPNGAGGTMAVTGGGLNLNGTVNTITISVNGQFRAFGSWQGGGAWSAVGTCSD
ncbi:MAG: peptidoglycan-binding domain-containing protein [Actinomycetota bacterium]